MNAAIPVSQKPLLSRKKCILGPRCVFEGRGGGYCTTAFGESTYTYKFSQGSSESLPQSVEQAGSLTASLRSSSWNSLNATDWGCNSVRVSKGGILLFVQKIGLFPKVSHLFWSKLKTRVFVRIFQQDESVVGQTVPKPSRAFFSSPPRCLSSSQCFLMAASVNSHSRGLVSCLFGSAALYPVAQKPGDGPINGRATYPVIQRTNNVCSHQSAGMEGAQRPCVLYQRF